MSIDLAQLRKDGFTFKRFFVAHDKSPMKVTTDSALLGAWAPISHGIKNVLDIGCGCGIIALMLAQRLEKSNCTIDAIDISYDAVNQCQQNIDNSPFNNLKAQCVDIKEYKISENRCYDLIVCNPPYFEPAVDCRNEQRQQARYTETLNHRQLLHTVTRLLSKKGLFCLVLPYHLSEQFKMLCKSYNLYLAKEMSVRYTNEKPFSLSLLCFSQESFHVPIIETLIMRNTDNSYSEDFRKRLNEFYLFRK